MAKNAIGIGMRLATLTVAACSIVFAQNPSSQVFSPATSIATNKSLIDPPVLQAIDTDPNIAALNVQQMMLDHLLGELNVAFAANIAPEAPVEIRQALAEAIVAEVQPVVTKSFEDRPRRGKKQMLTRSMKAVRKAFAGFGKRAYRESPVSAAVDLVRHPKQSWKISTFRLGASSVCMFGLQVAAGFGGCSFVPLVGQMLFAPQAQAQTSDEVRQPKQIVVKESLKPLTPRELEGIDGNTQYGKRFTLARPFVQQPLTIFGSQPRYAENREYVDKLPLASATQLGLTGKRVYNEVCGRVAVEGELLPTTQLRYDPAIPDQYWMVGCMCGSQNYLNMIQPVERQIVKIEPSQPIVQPQQIAQATPPSISQVNEGAKIPDTIVLRAEGFQQPQAPTKQDITYRVIIENRTRETVADKINKIGGGVGKGAAGVGVLVFATKYPGSKVEQERIRQNGNRDVATTNATAHVRGKEVDADAVKTVSGNQLQGVIHTNEAAQKVATTVTNGNVTISENQRNGLVESTKVAAGAQVQSTQIAVTGAQEVQRIVNTGTETVARIGQVTAENVAKITGEFNVQTAVATPPDQTNINLTAINSAEGGAGGAGGLGGSSTVSVIGGNATGGQGGSATANPNVDVASNSTANPNIDVKGGTANANNSGQKTNVDASSSSKSTGNTSSANNSGVNVKTNVDNGNSIDVDASSKIAGSGNSSAKSNSTGGTSNANNQGVHAGGAKIGNVTSGSQSGAVTGPVTATGTGTGGNSSATGGNSESNSNSKATGGYSSSNTNTNVDNNSSSKSNATGGTGGSATNSTEIGNQTSTTNQNANNTGGTLNNNQSTSSLNNNQNASNGNVSQTTGKTNATNGNTTNQSTGNQTSITGNTANQTANQSATNQNVGQTGTVRP